MKLKIIFTAIILVILGIGWSFFIEPNIIKVEKISFKIENLSSGFSALSAAQISDLHFREFGAKEKRVLAVLEELDPDLIFVTGDLVDWTGQIGNELDNFLKGLSGGGRRRIFLVYGNHDHRNRSFKNLEEILKENQIEVLSNESELVDGVYIIGVDDPHLGYDDIDKATSGQLAGAPKILLAHSPEIFRKVKGKNIDLVLSGHTHGCQINIPVLCDLFIPLDYDKQYKAGLFKEDGTYLYVNRGIGNTFLPFRINSFPEITLINFE